MSDEPTLRLAVYVPKPAPFPTLITMLIPLSART